MAESDYTQDFEDIADSQSMHESMRSPPLSARRHVSDRHVSDRQWQSRAPSVSMDMDVEDHAGSISMGYEVEDHVGSVSYASTPGRGSIGIGIAGRSADRSLHASVDRSVVFSGAGPAGSGSMRSASVASGSINAASVELGHVSIIDPREVGAMMFFCVLKARSCHQPNRHFYCVCE